MRTVAEYVAKATEFDDLAAITPDPALRKRYADLADGYRVLAKNGERIIAADKPHPKAAGCDREAR
jgi:hypothetical protein